MFFVSPPFKSSLPTANKNNTNCPLKNGAWNFRHQKLPKIISFSDCSKHKVHVIFYRVLFKILKKFAPRSYSSIQRDKTGSRIPSDKIDSLRNVMKSDILRFKNISWGRPSGATVKCTRSASWPRVHRFGSLVRTRHHLACHAVVGVSHIKWRKMGTDVSSGPVFLSKKWRIGSS